MTLQEWVDLPQPGLDHIKDHLRKEMGAKAMTLCEALDWCRANNATVEFRKALVRVTVEVFTHPQRTIRVEGLSLEVAVDKAVCEIALPGETVAEAARRGFSEAMDQSTAEAKKRFEEADRNDKVHGCDY